MQSASKRGVQAICLLQTWPRCSNNCNSSKSKPHFNTYPPPKKKHLSQPTSIALKSSRMKTSWQTTSSWLRNQLCFRRLRRRTLLTKPSRLKVRNPLQRHSQSGMTVSTQMRNSTLRQALPRGEEEPLQNRCSKRNNSSRPLKRLLSLWRTCLLTKKK